MANYNPHGDIMHWLDPDDLRATTGTVKQYLLNPHGDADGFILSDGTEVHFPPHMSKEMQEAVAVGDEVTIRGAKPRDADVIAAVAVDTKNGRRIDDRGPPDDDDQHHAKPHKPKHTEMEYAGVLVRKLHGPKGEVRGALFEGGVTIRFPKHEAEGVLHLLTDGASVSVRGKGLKNDVGMVIDVEKIGPSLDQLTSVKHAKHENDKHRHKD